MSELETTKKIDSPRTVESLSKDLVNIGLKPGNKVIVHSSMSKIGWISVQIQSFRH